MTKSPLEKEISAPDKNIFGKNEFYIPEWSSIRGCHPANKLLGESICPVLRIRPSVCFILSCIA
jgi:hypothetical protein